MATVRSRDPRHHIHLREKRPVFYDDEVRIDNDFRKFIETRILPIILFSGYKLRQKRKVAIQCIFNLSIAFWAGKVLVDVRDNSKNGLRIAVWDALEEAGLCRVCRGVEGITGELRGFASRYQLTGKLLTLLDEYEGEYLLDYKLARNSERKIPTNHAFVVLHKGTKDLATGKKLSPSESKKPIRFDLLDYRILRQFAEAETKIEIINHNNLNHTWRVEGKNGSYAPNPCLKQTHSAAPNRYGRLIQWSVISVQSLSKKTRKRIRIDGERVTEFDFSGFDIRRCYNYRGIDPDKKEDIYRSERILRRFYKRRKGAKSKKIVRDFIKTATNICFNVESKGRAVRAVHEQLVKHDKKRLLYRIFYKIERMERPAKEIVERIIKVHLDIQEDFFKCISIGEYTSPLGSSMMTLGAAMMLDILWWFTQAGKPAVTIHDAVLCKRSDRKFARRVMVKAYKKWAAGFRPVIKREF